MRQIGFKNFRKFADFPMMDLAPITMFVGENNSGKSTIVKGILALSDFFSAKEQNYFDFVSTRENRQFRDEKQMNIEYLINQKFYFNTSYYAHIGTFKRALYNKANEDIITFKATTGLSTYEIEVNGKHTNEDAVFGIISRIHIYIDIFCISLDFDLQNDKMQVIFHSVKKYTNNTDLLYTISSHERLKNEIQEYSEYLDDDLSLSASISDFLQIHVGVDIMRQLTGSACNLLTYIIHKEDNEAPMERNLRGYFYPIDPIEGLTDEIKSFLQKCSELSCFGAEKRFAPHSMVRFTLPDQDLVRRTFDIEYIYAHAVAQTVIYSAKDTNDYLSKTIHEFAPYQGHKQKRDFILKWMKEFNIGKDFKIKSVGGEAHIVYITNIDGEKVNLADKGMGSIQLMVLLFRLALIIQSKKYRGFFRNQDKIVIVEEPEQNLHPSLQSKLADLFYEVNRGYGFRFIIETHSEYLIRRSQIIVGENYPTQESLKDNPFKVYYFPSEGEPYDMGYRTTGSFSEPFGSGFYDEAAKMDMEIIKREMNNPIRRRR